MAAFTSSLYRSRRRLSTWLALFNFADAARSFASALAASFAIFAAAALASLSVFCCSRSAFFAANFAARTASRCSGVTANLANLKVYSLIMDIIKRCIHLLISLSLLPQGFLCLLDQDPIRMRDDHGALTSSWQFVAMSHAVNNLCSPLGRRLGSPAARPSLCQ